VVEFLPQLIQHRQKETLKKVVNVLLTDVTPSKAAREQARMLIEAKTTMLKSGDCLPQQQLPSRSSERGFEAHRPPALPVSFWL
jgi:hypothetical protein